MNNLQEINQVLCSLQNSMTCPKSNARQDQYASYSFRTGEDIIAAFKKACERDDITLIMSDSLIERCGSVYVESTATISDGVSSISASGYAKETTKKQFDEPQRTGSASSYARKYALCGLFAIDAEKHDVDSNEHHKVINDGEVKERKLIKQTVTNIRNHFKSKLITEMIYEIENPDLQVESCLPQIKGVSKNRIIEQLWVELSPEIRALYKKRDQVNETV